MAGWVCCADRRIGRGTRGRTPQLSQTEIATVENLRPVLDRYCIACHNQR